MQLLPPEAYQAAAESTYQALAAQLAGLLPAARFEHVGASSIPGAISKGDLDICVIVSATEHEATVERLVAAGFRLKADTLRTPELCMLEAAATGFDTALQVIAAGSRFEFFMQFRDRLRSDPALVEAYNRIKQAHTNANADAYRAAKGRFIESVLAGQDAPSRAAAGRDFAALNLQTHRLELRPLREGDAEGLFAIFSDPEFMRYWSSAPWTRLDQAKELIARDRRELAQGEHLRLGIFLRNSQALVGTCSLFHINDSCRRAEVGYGIARPHWRQGLMHEAVSALINHAFDELRLHRLEADIDPRNLASARGLEKLGFLREGLLRERWMVDGQVSDSALYGLLARDWAPSPIQD